MKKTIALALTVALTASLLAGCGGTGSVSRKSTESGPPMKDGKYDPTITITIGKQLDENAGKYINGESLNDNVLTRWGVQNLGIQVKTSLLGGDASNYNTKLRLALTGSEKLPDAFPVYDTQLASDLIESGRVKDITGDIADYMPKRLKAIYKKYPQTFNPVVKDGKVYGLAVTPYLSGGEVMLIRQDWLDKLGLKAPTTIDEFQNVIAAFTDKDPDGDGKKDTYGFDLSGKDSFNTAWVSDPVMIFSAYTGKVLPSQWYDDNGKLTYGSLAEGNKQALAKLRDWYAKGYLNKELATQDAWAAVDDFTAGKAGIIVGMPWLYDIVSDLEKTQKGAKIAAYPTIKGINGQQTYQSASLNDGILMFNKDFKYMKAFFEYYDKLYDAAFATGDFKYGYAKGYDYDIVNGKVTYDPSKFNKPLKAIVNVGKMSITKNTPQLDGTGQDYANYVAGKLDQNSAAYIKAAATSRITLDGYAITYQNRKYLSTNAFNGPPTSTMQSMWEQLTTMEKEVYTKIIYGEQPVSAFDTFVKQWKAKGGDQITKEVNTWYKQVNNTALMGKMGLK